MKRSVPAFIVGLISSIVGAVASYLIFVVVGLIGAFSVGATQQILTIFPFLNMGTFVLAFIGSCFCLGIPKTGSIILFIASGLSTICHIFICIGLKSFNILFILFWLPTLFVIIAGIISIYAKKS